MGKIGKSFALVLILVIAISSLSLIVIKPTFAQTTNQPIPEFTLKVADHSYNVPATIVSTTDPYTNVTTSKNIAGYYVENKTIDAIIKNNGASFFNFRYKPHFVDRWSYYPFSPDNTNYIVPSAYDLSNVYNASLSDYTTISLTFLPTISQGGQIDIQIQGLFGSYQKQPSGMRGVGLPTYDFTFSGEASNWSNTQTVTLSSSSPTPTPSVPEFSWLAILPLFIALMFIAIKLRNLKTTKINVPLKTCSKIF